MTATPDDDLPRLVAADWLDEHGDPERAEFVRAQCEWAKLEAKKRKGAVDRCQFALRAFVRLEWHRVTTGVSGFAAEIGIIREAIRGFFVQGVLPPPASRRAATPTPRCGPQPQSVR